MKGHQSAAMDKAIKLIKEGKTATQAANISGITRSHLYRHPEYKKHRKERKNA